MTNPTEDPAAHVIVEATLYLYPAALRAAVLLDVADHLVDGPRTVAELAELTGAKGPALRRLLRFLATRGTFREDEEGRFGLTPYADVLRAEAPNSVRAVVLTATSELWWRSAGDLVEAARSGEPAFDHHYGRPFFDHLAENPDDGAVFTAGMARFSAGQTEQIVASYEFPETGVVVDVGGGVGGLLLAVLRARPGLSGVLVDHEKVLAANVLGELAAPDRWELVSGDFFESVPAGDLYTLKNIVHDWNDERCVRLLSNCRASMRPGGKLLIIDAIIPPGNEPHSGKEADMVMLMLLTGQERTMPEFERLLERAGLRITDVLPTQGMVSIIEASPLPRD
jgi:hypothetical protein